VSGDRRRRLARLEAKRGGGGERERMEKLVRSIFNPFDLPDDELALLVELFRRCPYEPGTHAQEVERWRRACSDAELPLFDRALARVPATEEALARLTLAVGDNCL
jgi:hypothetical protein